MSTKTNTIKTNTKTNTIAPKKEEATMSTKTKKTEPKTVAPKTDAKTESKPDFRAIVEKMLTDAKVPHKYLEKLNRTCALTESGRMIFLVEYKRTGIAIRSKLDAVPSDLAGLVQTVAGKPTAPCRVSVTGEAEVRVLVAAYLEQLPKTLTERKAAKDAADAEKKAKSDAKKSSAKKSDADAKKSGKAAK